MGPRPAQGHPFFQRSADSPACICQALTTPSRPMETIPRSRFCDRRCDKSRSQKDDAEAAKRRARKAKKSMGVGALGETTCIGRGVGKLVPAHGEREACRWLHGAGGRRSAHRRSRSSIPSRSNMTAGTGEALRKHLAKKGFVDIEVTLAAVTIQQHAVGLGFDQGSVAAIYARGLIRFWAADAGSGPACSREPLKLPPDIRSGHGSGAHAG